MAVDQHRIEEKLAEFTQMHGTILLGMHRDLTSHLEKVDTKLESTTQDLNDYATRILQDLQVQSDAVDERNSLITQYLAETETTILESTSSLAEMVQTTQKDTHSLIDDACRRVDERYSEVNRYIEISLSEYQKSIKASQCSIEEAIQALSAVVQKTEHDARELIVDVSIKADNAFKEAVNSFALALNGYQISIKESESAIISYMESQENRLKIQSQNLETRGDEIKSLTQTAQNRLDEIEKRESEHQQREAAFNNRVRKLALSFYVTSAIILTVMGVWKFWIH